MHIFFQRRPSRCFWGSWGSGALISHSAKARGFAARILSITHSEWLRETTMTRCSRLLLGKLVESDGEWRLLEDGEKEASDTQWHQLLQALLAKVAVHKDGLQRRWHSDALWRLASTPETSARGVGHRQRAGMACTDQLRTPRDAGRGHMQRHRWQRHGEEEDWTKGHCRNAFVYRKVSNFNLIDFSLIWSILKYVQITLNIIHILSRFF